MTAVPGARTAGAELKNDVLFGSVMGVGAERCVASSSLKGTDVLAIEIAYLELEDHTYA
jgi:hypothetical protein